MRLGWLVVLGLMQAGCLALGVPPLEARMAVGPGWDARAHAVRTVPGYQATLPFTSGPDWVWGHRLDVRAGYLLEPLAPGRLIHGPLLGAGVLFERPGPPPVLRREGVGQGVSIPGPQSLQDGDLLWRYGVHGQVRALLGQGTGVEAALQVSWEWGLYVLGFQPTSPLDAFVLTGHGYAGPRVTRLFIEASAGVQDGHPRWGLCAGLAFRLPAAFAMAIVNRERLRNTAWVREINRKRSE